MKSKSQLIQAAICLIGVAAICSPAAAQITVTASHTTVENALISAIGNPARFNFGHVAVDNISASTGDWRVTFTDTNGFRLQGPRTTITASGRGGRGTRLGTEFSVEGIDQRFNLNGRNKVDFIVTIKNQGRIAIEQWTKKKWFITLVKPIVVEPFDVKVKLPATIWMEGKTLKVEFGKMQAISGSIRVGAIGDGPNVWGTIHPVDAPTIRLRVNYFGFSFTVPNPLRGAMDKLNGRVVSIAF